MAQTPPPVNNCLRRKIAEEILDKVRELLASRASPETIEFVLFDVHGIPALTKCNGEAHANGRTDHCAVCMPRWGLLGDRIKIT